MIYINLLESSYSSQNPWSQVSRESLSDSQSSLSSSQAAGLDAPTLARIRRHRNSQLNHQSQSSYSSQNPWSQVSRKSISDSQSSCPSSQPGIEAGFSKNNQIDRICFSQQFFSQPANGADRPLKRCSNEAHHSGLEQVVLSAFDKTTADALRKACAAFADEEDATDDIACQLVILKSAIIDGTGEETYLENPSRSDLLLHEITMGYASSKLESYSQIVKQCIDNSKAYQRGYFSRIKACIVEVLDDIQKTIAATSKKQNLPAIEVESSQGLSDEGIYSCSSSDSLTPNSADANQFMSHQLFEFTCSGSHRPCMSADILEPPSKRRCCASQPANIAIESAGASSTSLSMRMVEKSNKNFEQIMSKLKQKIVDRQKALEKLNEEYKSLAERISVIRRGMREDQVAAATERMKKYFETRLDEVQEKQLKCHEHLASEKWRAFAERIERYLNTKINILIQCLNNEDINKFVEKFFLLDAQVASGLQQVVLARSKITRDVGHDPLTREE